MFGRFQKLMNMSRIYGNKCPTKYRVEKILRNLSKNDDPRYVLKLEELLATLKIKL